MEHRGARPLHLPPSPGGDLALMTWSQVGVARSRGGYLQPHRDSRHIIHDAAPPPCPVVMYTSEAKALRPDWSYRRVVLDADGESSPACPVAAQVESSSPPLATESTKKAPKKATVWHDGSGKKALGQKAMEALDMSKSKVFSAVGGGGCGEAFVDERATPPRLFLAHRPLRSTVFPGLVEL